MINLPKNTHEGATDGFLTGDDAVAFTNEWALSTKTFRTDLNNDNTLNVTDFNAWNDAFYDGSAVGRGVLSKADGADAAGPGNSRGWANGAPCPEYPLNYDRTVGCQTCTHPWNS